MRHVLFAALLVTGLAGIPAAPLVIDDFSTPGRSSLGTRWQAFTDRVMGGRSQMEAGFERDGNTVVLRMTGRVSLENNGGFIQVRLPLSERGTFDASEFSGIALETRGRPGSYFIHLRTRATRLPWQHYTAAIPVTPAWQRTVVPFDAFAPDSIRREIDPSRLTSIAVVAAGDRFEGDVAIRLIEFVP